MHRPIKLVFTYNMKPGREEACHQYVVEELGPALTEFGFRFTDAWFTAWGHSAQIMGAGLLPDAETARALLTSETWRKAVKGLQAYATDFTVRLIEPAAAFQI